jgi:hypothetical protein
MKCCHIIGCLNILTRQTLVLELSLFIDILAE